MVDVLVDLSILKGVAGGNEERPLDDFLFRLAGSILVGWDKANPVLVAIRVSICNIALVSHVYGGLSRPR